MSALKISPRVICVNQKRMHGRGVRPKKDYTTGWTIDFHISSLHWNNA